MAFMESLADFLGVPDPRPAEREPADDFDALIDVSDPVKFCQGIVASRQFRQYIMNGITLGDIPQSVMTRILDHAWGKPVDRVEHSGKDGKPIETITEVRRIVVRAERDTVYERMDEIEREAEKKPVTH